VSTFYKAFEERHRGSRELITSRLRQYKPFFMPIKNSGVSKYSLDLGCGRGEWLELLLEYGLKGHGVDLDAEMLQPARELGLQVSEADAISHLSLVPDDSVAIVSAFHLVEHLPFELLQKLVEEAYRVIMPGGLIILETPNPENIIVATSNFLLDPTHVRPIPPLLLSFIIEQRGFSPVKTVRLQESKSLHTKSDLTILEVLGGVSPDYSIVAQKPGDDRLTEALAEAFNLEFGLGLEQLALRYDEQMAALRSSEGPVRERIRQISERLVEVEGTLTKHQLKTDYLLTRSFWEKLLFRRSGKPKKALGRLLFHKSGKPRGMFKSLILHTDGRPQKPFMMYMASAQYQSLPGAIRRDALFQTTPMTKGAALPNLSPTANRIMKGISAQRNKINETKSGK
jgi:SAM-dependent methyltransferase